MLPDSGQVSDSQNFKADFQSRAIPYGIASLHGLSLILWLFLAPFDRIFGNSAQSDALVIPRRTVPQQSQPSIVC